MFTDGFGFPVLVRNPKLAFERGATLVELVISIVIISISVAAVIGTMSQMIGHSADPMIEAQAVAIAESYLEEITLKSYLDPDSGAVCPANEGSRALFDNLCDYNVLSDNGARDQSNTAIAGLGDYTVAVSVDQSANLGALSGGANVLRVDVRVTYSDAALADFTLSGYRTNY